MIFSEETTFHIIWLCRDRGLSPAETLAVFRDLEKGLRGRA